MGEMGYSGFEFMSWLGLFVPAGTPKAVVTRLNAEINRASLEPEYIALVAETGGEMVTTPTPEQFRNFTYAEIGRSGNSRESAEIATFTHHPLWLQFTGLMSPPVSPLESQDQTLQTPLKQSVWNLWKGLFSTK